MVIGAIIQMVICLKKMNIGRVCVAVFVFVLSVIIFAININPEVYLYNAIKRTAMQIGDSLKPLSLNESSCTLDVYKLKNGKMSRIVSFSNDKANKELSLMMYSKNTDGQLYIGENKVGFGIYGDTTKKYTASSYGFRTLWNKSIYSSYFEIPSFVPDNLNYDSVSQNLDGTDIAVFVLGLFSNTKEGDFDGLLSDINVTSKGNIKISKNGKGLSCRHFKVTVPQIHVNKFLKSFPYLSCFKAKLSPLDILCHNGIINSAETSVVSDRAIYNIKFENSGNTQQFDISVFQNDTLKRCISLKCTQGSSGVFTELLSDNDKASVVLHTDNQGFPKLMFYTGGGGDDVYVAAMKKLNIRKKTDFYGKDIYSASLSDLYHIYRHFPSIFSLK